MTGLYVNAKTGVQLNTFTEFWGIYSRSSAELWIFREI